MANVNHIVKLFGDPTPFYYYIVEICGSLGFTGVVETTEVLTVGDVVSVGSGELRICTKVIGETTETISEVVIFDKYESCESCAACNGILYLAQGCNSESPELFLSFSFYNPGDRVQIGYECYNIITSIPYADSDPVSNIYSAPLCSGCTPTKIIRTTTSCLTGEQIPVYVYADINSMSGDVVSVGILDLVFECAILGDIVPSEEFSILGGQFIDSKKQQNCDYCYLNYTPVIVSFVSCSDPEGPVYQGVFTLLSLINFSSPLNNFVFSFGDTECYTVVGVDGEGCPVDMQRYRPSYFYQDCETCNQPLSAGTEYVGCYTCSGNTQTIQLPHPTWTNLSGKAVVEMNAVVLGGINGLNS